MLSQFNKYRDCKAIAMYLSWGKKAVSLGKERGVSIIIKILKSHIGIAGHLTDSVWCTGCSFTNKKQEGITEKGEGESRLKSKR